MSKTNGARMGITKSRSGHYAVWCQHSSDTAGKLTSKFRAAEVLKDAKAIVGDLSGFDAARVFSAWVRSGMKAPAPVAS